MLVRLARRGQVFSVKIGGKPYIPAVLADRSVDQRRLRKLLRRLPSSMPPMEKYFFFVGRRGSLGDKSPVQAVRRGKRFRVALRLADNEAAEVRLVQALRDGELSGPAASFDGKAFLRRKQANTAVCSSR
ncbi:type II toxin-antitoxin system ParD family antitoxin [Paraburkholderia sp. J76]|uniref:type II toxin-antitoxin system ParD family antitoxin n=1 Tax=Paraburkholderia sp. J76 TaxID=2805439 RepID=UPI002ABDD6B2|nr:type II toxin-antitoxin system ParD family antitoxin [Paraburkholderia sp. J76]